MDPVDHVARPALSWRTCSTLTECGMDLDRLPGRVLSVDELVARVRDLGQRRAAYTTCMTCWETAGRHRSHDPDPLGPLLRELETLRWVHLPAHDPPPPTDRVLTAREQAGARARARRRRLVRELEAIAALIAAHRDEYDGYLAGLDETVSLAARRTARQQRAPRPRTGGTL